MAAPTDMLTALVLSLALAGAPPAPKEPSVTQPTCLAELNLERGSNPWRGFTASADEESAGRTVKAVDDLTTLERVPQLSSYEVGGKPLLAIDREHKRVVVAAGHFSDLTRADVTRSGKLDLGTVKSAALRAEPRKLALFLVEAHLVQTIAHVESHVCLADEKDGAEEYRAHFTGTHVYFTNRRHESALEFEVLLDKKSGALRVESR